VDTAVRDTAEPVDTAAESVDTDAEPVDTAGVDTEVADSDAPVGTDTASDTAAPWPDTGDTWVSAVDTGDEPGVHTADTGSVPEEICNGLDDDGDGEIDEDPVDGQWYYEDLDGDGFGDTSTRVRACSPPPDHVRLPDDCDDTDPLVSPLSPDVFNGIDDDCDGQIDEADVAFVAAWQCIQDPGRAAETALEAQFVADFLADLDLTMIRIDALPGSSVPAGTDLSDYSLVLYTKCGWSWAAHNQGDVDALTVGVDGGAALFMFGDDMAYRMSNVVDAEPLVMLNSTSQNGTGSAHNSLLLFDTSATHPAYAGPYGTPVDYSYAWDMDEATQAVPAAQVLATHGTFGTPVFLAWEGPFTGRRQATLLTSVYNANHGSPGSLARVNAEIVFKNTVTWLLRL
jgi:hypothetical protein